MQLRHLIKKLLVQIAFISPLSGGINKNHQHETETLQGRLLSSFNQCADFPMIAFDLEFHTIDECVKLSASAIRCTIAPCKRGFVFVSWFWKVGDTRLGHATAFYFDGDRQYFFDPSGALKDVKDRLGYNAYNYFKWNHMWIPRSRVLSSSQLQCVDADLDVSIPSLQTVFSPHRTDDDPLKLRGPECFLVLTLWLGARL